VRVRRKIAGGSFPPAANTTTGPPNSASPPRAGVAGSPEKVRTVRSCFPAGETAEPSGLLVVGQQPELHATPRSCAQLTEQHAVARASFAMRSGLAHAASNQTERRSAIKIAVCRPRVDTLVRVTARAARRNRWEGRFLPFADRRSTTEPLPPSRGPRSFRVGRRPAFLAALRASSESRRRDSEVVLTY